MSMIMKTGIWVVAVTNALLSVGYALSFPFFAVYLSTEKGVPMGQVGFYLALSMLVGSFAQGLGGEISDSFGRKKVMLYSLGLRSASILLLSLCLAFDLHYGWLVGFHILGSFIGSFFNPAALAWVADRVIPQKRLEAYGMLRIGSNSGWALGPMIGGFIALKSYALLFALTALVFGLTGVLVYFFVKDAEVSAPAARQVRLSEMLKTLTNRRFALFCVYDMLIAAVMAQLVVGLSLYSVKYLGFTEKSVGFLFSVNGFMVVFFQYHVSKFLERMRITAGLALGCLLYAIGYFTVGMVSVFWAVLAGVIIFSAGELAVSPGMSALSANMAPKGRKGRYLGMNGLAHHIGFSAGIFLAGNGMQYLTPIWKPASWTVVSILALMSGLGFWSLKKHLSDEEDGMKSGYGDEKETI